MVLEICQCPVHTEFWSVCIGDEGMSTRLTPSKCCGRWRTIKTWNITSGLAEEAIRLFEEAKEEQEKQNDE